MQRLPYIIVIFLLLTVGCGGRDGNGNGSDETREQIHALDDSIAVMSPDARRMIERGMAEAKDSLTWYEFYLRYGKYYLMSQSPESLLSYADRTIAFVERQEPSPRMNEFKALAYEYKADYRQRYRRDLDEAISLHTTAYEAMMQSDNKNFVPEICANMADTYIQLNDMAQAASWYRRALFLVDSLQLPKIKNVTLYLGLAQIYMNLEDYETSLRYYRECGDFYDIMPVNIQVYYLNNFGNYYYYRADYPNALTMFTRMKMLLEKHGDEGIDMSTCRINLADVYLNLDSLDRVEQYVAPAERFFAANGMDIGVYYANSIRIGLAVRRGRTDEVRQILASETFAQPLEYNLVGIRNRYLREYYKTVGNWRAAYDNLQRDIHARDSIEKARQHMRASEIMQRLKEDTLMLHHAMEMQKKDNALRVSRITMGTTAALIVLAMLALAAYARKRKLQNEMDTMLLKLNNVRNRISPHFIFNVLNNHISTVGTAERDALITLTKLIRANLDISRNAFVSLADEMKFVRYYIEIERTVMGDDFTFTVAAPDDDILEKISIPTMTVQILVENSLKHGLKGKEGPKRLDVTVRTGTQGTDITVSDNGPGFDIRRVSNSSTRSGLDIIRHTIRIINKRQKGKGLMAFDIRNRKDAEGRITGCESLLHIPSSPTPEFNY